MSTVGDILSTVGDILRTVRVFSTVEGYNEYREGILSAMGDTPYRGGYIMSTVGGVQHRRGKHFLLFGYPHGTEYPTVDMKSPTCI